MRVRTKDLGHLLKAAVTDLAGAEILMGVL